MLLPIRDSNTNTDEPIFSHRSSVKKWTRPIKNWRLALKRLVLSLVSGSTSTSKKEFTQTIYTLLFIVLNKEFLFWGIDLYFKLKSL